MAWALLSQTDHSAAGVTVAPDGLSAGMSSGHVRLDQGNSTGKRQIDCVNAGGGAAKIVVCLCLLASGIDDAINGADHYTYDGTGVLSVPPGWGTGVAVLHFGETVSMTVDFEAHTAAVYKDGVLLGGWTGLSAGTYSVLFGSTTDIATASVEIISDPDDFPFPVSGYTGFGTDPAPAASGNFLALI